MRSGLLSGARRLLLALEGLLEHSGRRRGRYLFLHRSGGKVYCQACDPWTLTIIVFLTGFITFTPSIVGDPTPLDGCYVPPTRNHGIGTIDVKGKGRHQHSCRMRTSQLLIITNSAVGKLCKVSPVILMLTSAHGGSGH